MLALGIIVLIIMNLTIGSVSIPVEAVFNILNPFKSPAIKGEYADVWTNIILYIRLPQTVTAIACGAGLSVAGIEMQTVFRNPLAGPSVLGISSAASLGVAFIVLLSGTFGGVSLSQFGIIGNSAITLAAITGALLVMLLIVYLWKRYIADNRCLDWIYCYGYYRGAEILFKRRRYKSLCNMGLGVICKSYGRTSICVCWSYCCYPSFCTAAYQAAQHYVVGRHVCHEPRT